MPKFQYENPKQEKGGLRNIDLFENQLLQIFQEKHNSKITMELITNLPKFEWETEF